ncbi:hypothetical protein D0Z08_00605 [Nocardioides immobilis]|uniref:DUF3558 domain-containing protein n=1 Tax=Nocardioides immobilis TaxID=2049295 RepID=A0A417Y9B2_9ACTN|nr:hypothetical protein [Nocardioides immobilis]RHW29064.1 hypothetical protein D0Z08_00605 [Nocardioides immobilis]
MRRSVAAGAAVLLLALAGCGDGEEVGEKPDLPDETPALWNPCDVLDDRFVEKTFGTVAEEDNGEPTLPECRFAPDEGTGQPVVTANYSLFSGTLDEAWDKMGQPEKADVREPKIPGAESSKVVVAVVKKQLYVDGFVQNGELIQQVAVVAPAPYDEDRIVAGVEKTLTRLATHAAESGLEGTD